MWSWECCVVTTLGFFSFLEFSLVILTCVDAKEGKKNARVI